MRKVSVSAATVVIVLATASEAFAYLDGGSGSMLIQLLLGGVGGALVLLKMYWRRVSEALGWSDAAGRTDPASDDDSRGA